MKHFATIDASALRAGAVLVQGPRRVTVVKVRKVGNVMDMRVRQQGSVVPFSLRSNERVTVERES